MNAFGIRLVRFTLLVAAAITASGQEPSPETLLRSAAAAARTGSLEKSQPLFLSALDAARARSGRDDLGVANVLHEYGVALRTAGQPEQAAGALAKALAIRDRELPDDHAWIAFTAAQLAWAQFAIQRYDDALATNRRAVAILESNRAPRHVLLASQIGLQGRIYSTQDKLAEAAHEFERGIDVLRKDAAPDTRLMAQFYWLLGSVRARQSNGEAPAGAYESALELDHETPALSNAQRTEAEYAVGVSQRAASQPRQAIERLRRALSIYEQLDGGNPRLEASICVELAQSYQELREYSQAETMYLRAAAILKANGAEGTPSYHSIVDALDKLYRAR